MAREAGRRSAWSTYAPVVRATFWVALACNAALELSRVVGVDGGPWRFKTPWYPVLFALGTLVVWLLVGLVQAVTGRLWLTRTVMAAVTLLVAVADHQKVSVREEPLYPSDMAFITQLQVLADMVGLGWFLATAAALAVVAVAVAAVWLTHRRRRRPRRVSAERPTAHGSPVVVRLVAGALCLLALVHVSHFNQPGNLARAVFDAAGAEWRPWSQQRNYLGNGFVAGVLYNTDVPPMAPPAGYGPATMAEIVGRYTAVADGINRDRKTGSLDDVNVLMVLSESLSDPADLEGVSLARDPLPFTHRLMQRTTSGRLLAPGIGGGTANAEFEVLTGMSLGLFPAQLRVPYQMLVPDRAHFPSFVEWYERTGHRPVAVHPFSTEMYRRSDVYRAFGFDDFVSEDRMAAPARIGHDAYVSDASAFDEVVGRLQHSARPMFVQLVTMQNHIPYEGRYAHPIPVRGPDGAPIPPTGQYLRGLWHSDRALQGLIGDLRRLHEPTVLVVYGDHLPGTYPGEVRDLNDYRTMRSTPFLVWSTFPGTPLHPPQMSPTHLTDVLLEHVGAPVTPYTALLTRLRATIPAFDGRFLYDAAGRPVQVTDLPMSSRRLLHDYRLVQYDLSAGRAFSEDGMLGG